MLLFEIWTLGRQPYEGTSTDEVRISTSTAMCSTVDSSLNVSTLHTKALLEYAVHADYPDIYLIIELMIL